MPAPNLHTPERVTRCKTLYGDPGMSDAALVGEHLSRLNAGYPQTVGGIAEDTGLPPATVEALVVAVGARRHPLRDREPRTIHTPAVRWSAPRGK